MNISPEMYSEPCQTLKMEHFAKIVNGFRPLTLFRVGLCGTVHGWRTGAASLLKPVVLIPQ